MTHVDLSFLQIFIWEWFSVVVPKPVKYPEVVKEKTRFSNGSSGMKPSTIYKP